MKTHLVSAVVLTALLLCDSASHAGQTDLLGPAGSGGFGTAITRLPNGNLVITDPLFDAPGAVDAGAVYLYGPTGTLISRLTGSTANDKVGNGTVTVLTNGNFVVRSFSWNNGAATSAGAVTWGSATTGFGVSAVVSSSNSIVGGSSSDSIGSSGIYPLPNGNYVVGSPLWNNTSPAANDAGAATWCDGTTGTSGLVSETNSLVATSASSRISLYGIYVVGSSNYVVASADWSNTSPVVGGAGAVTWANGATGLTGAVSSANSLVGSSSSNAVGSRGVLVLTNGNYLVHSPKWFNSGSSAPEAGAVTWCDGSAGTTGEVTVVNSLVGTHFEDHVGEFLATALTNGNYVVCSRSWGDNDEGAATWGSGTSGVAGAISAANSLVGTAASQQVGYRGAVALTNGNYVVCSPFWDNGAPADVGAVTWCNGTTGLAGSVTASNSLTGSTAGDQVGNYTAVALTNGNYVVRSSLWNKTAPLVSKVGAVTWGNGTTGITGTVSVANSLVGSTANDQVGDTAVSPLTNGNYVVSSNVWDKPSPATADVGAVTWGNGTTGIKGVVSASNSLIGSSTLDRVGSGGITILSNGNYVVNSEEWTNPATAVLNVGASTWCNGSTGRSGGVSAANSLVGSTDNDGVGHFAVALTNGNYVVISAGWDNGSIDRAGAVTWASGTSGITGPVTPANSLVGITASDLVGNASVIALSDGNYVVRSYAWNNFLITSVSGAFTLGDGQVGSRGPVHSGNSVLGGVFNVGDTMVFQYAPDTDQLIVGEPKRNRFSLFTASPEISVEQPLGTNHIDNVHPVNFGSVAVGGISASFVFTIKSIGTVPLHITGVSVIGTNPGDFALNTTGMSNTIAPDGSTTLSMTFSPGALFARSATLQILCDDTSEAIFTVPLQGTGTQSSGSLAFGATGYTVEEDDGNATIPVTRTGGTFGSVTVKVQTSNGTASSPGDFTALAPTYEVVIPNGQTTANALIPIINGPSSELNESFTLTLSSPTGGATLGAQTTTTVTIVDLSAFSETLPPSTPVITAPAVDARVGVNTGGTLTVTGTAADKQGVKQVQVALNGGAFTNAALAKPGAPSTAYSLALTPVTGLNTIQVQSTDYSNLTSTIITRSFVVTRPLAVTVNAAQGSVTTGFAPTSFREVGKLVSLKSTPKPGYLFWRWLVNGLPDNGAIIGVPNSDIDNTALSFVFKEGTTLEAQFVLAFYAGEANNGSYAGAVQASTMLPDRAPLGAGSEDGTLPDITTEGLFTASVTKLGGFSGKLTIDGLVLPVAGSFDAIGEARFGSSRSRVMSVARTGKPSLVVALQLFNNSRTITGTVAQYGSVELSHVSTISAPQAFYSLAANVVDSDYLVIAGTKKNPGVFNARFAALGLGSQPPGLTANDYPQGDGLGVFKLTSKGAVSLGGTLSDGTAITASTTLSQTNTFRLFAQLYGKRGFIAGNVAFNKTAPTTDLSATNVLWFRPVLDMQHYSNGWSGVKLDLLGAKYTAVTGTSVLTGLTVAHNADLVFNNGGLSGTVNRVVAVSNADAVTELPVDAGYSLSIARSTGKFSGGFTHNFNGTKPTFQGIILQKGTARGGYGFWLTPTPKPKDYTGQSGGVLLTPQ